MTGFELSPGITPLLADAAVVVLPLAIAAGVLAGGRRCLLVALGAVTAVLGLIKVLTDWGDLKDLVVGLAGVGVGLAAVIETLDVPALRTLPRALEIALGAAGVLVGTYKVVSDFYDPFDAELGALTASVALQVVVARSLRRRGASVPPPDPAARGAPSPGPNP